MIPHFSAAQSSQAKSRVIRVGTDCSGIEAPIQALERVGIPFRHVFSCEIDKYARESIQANYHPDILFKDIRKRKLSDVPDIDLYVCGFPCQSFSMAGDRKGVNDPRGTIFWECLKVITKKLPKVFILENVKGLLSIDDGRTFKEILKALEKIKKYDIHWNVLNTRDYGIPQNRERVFIIGIRSDQKLEFEWPKKQLMEDINDYVDFTDTVRDDVTLRMKKYLKKLRRDSVFIDLGFTGYTDYPNSYRWCPCLNTKPNLWCVPLHRKASIRECLSLQGFPVNFNQVVSNTQMKKQIGNSMSVNVLEELLRCIYMSS